VSRNSFWQPPPHPLAIREWDDGFVVYNEATGDTHHLCALAGVVLLTLLDHPEGIRQVAVKAEIRRRVVVPDEASLDVEVEQVLSRLVQLRLASAVSLP
jgi:PqqD family protein of HPr-rel-A system